MHSLKRLWVLSGLLFCLALSGCGGRKEIRISGAEPVSSAVVQAAGPKENLPKTGDTPPAEAESGLTVYVCGEVIHPGVVELREGARIYEAVDASGGFTADADPERVNLAQPLTDGQMVVIASKQERTGSSEAGRAGIDDSYPSGTGTSGSESGPGLSSSGSRVNLNTASREAWSWRMPVSWPFKALSMTACISRTPFSAAAAEKVSGCFRAIFTAP